MKSFMSKKHRLEEKQARCMFKPIADAIRYVHSQNVALTNIKLDNILIDRLRTPKIIDFGLASISKWDRIDVSNLSPEYMPPELFYNQECEGTSIDVWALGVILYYMLCGCYPFQGNTESDAEIINDLMLPDYLSPKAKNILKRMLDGDPENRYTTKQILEDPWIKSNE